MVIGDSTLRPKTARFINYVNFHHVLNLILMNAAYTRQMQARCTSFDNFATVCDVVMSSYMKHEFHATFGGT